MNVLDSPQGEADRDKAAWPGTAVLTRRAMLAGVSGFAALLVPMGVLHAQDGRTVYERLAFNRPDAAVEAFLRAWRAQDFAMVFWILSRRTQRAIFEGIATTYSYTPLIGPLPDEARWVFTERLAAYDDWPQEDVAWLFDHIMMTGRAAGTVPFVLPDGAGPGAVRPLAADKVVIPVASLEFELVRDAGGQWRVLGVFAPGTHHSALPWGLRP